MPEKYRVEIVPPALVDLASIFEFIEKDSPRHASRMIEILLEAIETLRFFPYRHAPIRGSRKERRGVRSMVVQPYLIDYQVNKSNGTVYVLRVRHGARHNYG